MFEWKKLGRIFNPVDHREKSWMYEYAQAPSIVEFEKTIRVFFSARPAPENGISRIHKIRRERVCAESWRMWREKG